MDCRLSLRNQPHRVGGLSLQADAAETRRRARSERRAAFADTRSRGRHTGAFIATDGNAG